MTGKDKMRKSHSDDWEKIDAEIYTATLSIRGGGISYPVSYEGIRIAWLSCIGQVQFVNREKWKKGWKFKFEWNGVEKFFYRYVGK